MPVPFFNVLNGGMHSGNTMAFQEFMIAPVGASSFADAVRIGAEVYSELKTVITEKFGKSGMSRATPHTTVIQSMLCSTPDSPGTT
jgi:enolase